MGLVNCSPAMYLFDKRFRCPDESRRRDSAGTVCYVNGGCKDAHGNYRRFQGRKERDPKTRAKTFDGIAQAMAEQWGNL